MIRKYHDHKLQTNPWHREGEQHSNDETLWWISRNFLESEIRLQNNIQRDQQLTRIPEHAFIKHATVVHAKIKQILVKSKSRDTESMQKCTNHRRLKYVRITTF